MESGGDFPLGEKLRQRWGEQEMESVPEGQGGWERQDK